MPRKKTTVSELGNVKEEIKTADVAATEEKPVAVEEKPKSNRGRKPSAKKAVSVAEEIVEVEVEVAPVAEVTTPVEEEKKSASKKSTAKKTTAKKTVSKKTTAKKTTRKEAPVAEEKPVKKTDSRKASVNVFFQYQGMESAELINKAKELSGVKSPKSVNLYIKPEENKVYFVVDDKAGSFDL